MLDVVDYFETRLPQHGWTLVRRSPETEESAWMIWRKFDSTAKLQLSQTRNESISIELRVGTSRDPNYVP